jgi:magnesium transporter
VWIDIDLDGGGSLDVVSEALGLTDRDRRRIEADTARPRLVQSVGRLHLTVEALEPDGDDHDDPLYRREIDLLAGPNLVVSVHRGPVLALDRFEDSLHDETSLGALDAGDLLSTIVDEVISGYYRLVESVEQRIDRLDQAALMAGPEADVLGEIVAVRRRIGQIRRTLAPHRTALAALARPEMRLEETVGRPWPGLIDRLEVALSSVEALRDALLGTYDIHMGRVAQRANDVMKALTVLSAVLLPAVVLAGLMGMNFDHPFFDDDGNLYVVLGAMVVFSILLIAIAHWRRWI